MGFSVVRGVATSPMGFWCTNRKNERINALRTKHVLENNVSRVCSYFLWIELYFLRTNISNTKRRGERRRNHQGAW